ncbi:Ide [Symbiodinium pilosum]|uniref:peptidylprolyl isomerase n=1 Tax=Symbiodinium pilosum TaxID=2952 RepID=A0A812XGP4_SYMPI|nr:Ide [Symbiodinium pilosum]
MSSSTACAVKSTAPCRGEYKPITLRNGLRVLLCSDRAADRAAAALDVHVGFFNDPPAVQGLAHFCEHMLFLGTEPFPEENSFDAYLTANSGYSNAYTEAEDTCFFFSCSTAGLRSALERFGTFFQKPLFTASATEREVNAINSEHLKNVPNDVFRLGQVLNYRANPAHPYHQFGTGNIKTLLQDTAGTGVNLRAELLRYYRRYYRAPLMTLCILGDASPDLLASYAEQFFGGIPGAAEGERLEPSASYANQPLFLPEAFEQGVEAVPVADARELQVVFPVPFAPGTPIVTAEEAPKSPASGSMTSGSWRWYNPSSHVGSVLGHEGPHSLCALLRRRGWITELEVSGADDTDTFAVVVVSMELTEDGLAHKDEILELLFGYLNFLRGLPAWPQELLAENLQLSEAAWASRETDGPMEATVQLAGNMQDWKFPRDYLRASTRLRDGPGLAGTVDALLHFLRADNSIITAVSRKFEDAGNETEPWYGTRFRRRPLSQQPRWLRVSAAPGLGLPDPNPFLPRSLELKAQKVKISSKNAIVLPESKIDKVWQAFFRQDTEYGVPKAGIFIELRTKYPRSSARAAACARIYESMFRQALQETLLYDAEVAGLAFNFTTSMRGVELFFGGFDNRLPDFALTALGALLAFDASDARGFRAQADLLQRELDSFATQAPAGQAAYWSGLATVVGEISLKELRQALDGLTARDVAAFASALWTSPVVGVSLCEGNLRPQEADSFIAKVKEVLKAESFKVAPESEWPTPRVAKIPVNSVGPGVVLVNQIMDPTEENSAVEVSFQGGSTRSGTEADFKRLSELQVLAAVLSDEFYEELRTRQQLGYVVGCRLDRGEGTFRLVFLVQGAVLGPLQVLDRIDAFLDGAMGLINAKSEQDIAALADSLAEARLVRPQQLLESSQRRWAEICSRSFRWQRRLEEALALKAVIKADVQEAFLRWMAPGGAERRRLVSICGPGEALRTAAAELKGKGAQAAAMASLASAQLRAAPLLVLAAAIFVAWRASQWATAWVAPLRVQAVPKVQMRAEAAEAAPTAAAGRYAPPADLTAPPSAERSPSGLAWQVLEKGDGGLPPLRSDTILVRYTGWRASNGDLIDSSYLRQEQTKVKITSTIEGWQEGLQMMAPGEKRRFWIPAELSFGVEGIDDPEEAIGPLGDTIYDVEFVTVTEPDADPIFVYIGAGAAFLLTLTTIFSAVNEEPERREYETSAPFSVFERPDK